VPVRSLDLIKNSENSIKICTFQQKNHEKPSKNTDFAQKCRNSIKFPSIIQQNHLLQARQPDSKLGSLIQSLAA
jgi:hypothetical protein